MGRRDGTDGTTAERPHECCVFVLLWSRGHFIGGFPLPCSSSLIPIPLFPFQDSHVSISIFPFPDSHVFISIFPFPDPHVSIPWE